ERSEAESKGPAPDPSGTTAQARFPHLVAAVEKALGARFSAPVPVSVADDAGFQGAAAASVRAVPAARWAELRRLLVALEAIAPDADLAAPAARLRARNGVAVFDASRGALVLRRAALEAKGDAAAQARDAVIVHELARALDAQRGAAAPPAAPDGDDARGAAELLLDGDAQLATLRARSGGASDRAIADAVEGVRAAATRASGDASPFLNDVFVAYGTDGVLLAAALERSGGRRLVERAFAAPPATTEQALHPEKYLAGELPSRLAPADDGALRARGYAAVLERGLGELALRAWIGLRLGHDAGEGAAAGWDGDRAVLYAKAGAPDAVVWASAWDTEADAAEIEGAVVAVESRRGERRREEGCTAVALPAEPRRGAKAKVKVAPAVKDRADAVCRSGRVVALARDVPADLAIALARAAAATTPGATAPAPRLAGARFVPAAAGVIETSRGREEGLRYVNDAFGFRLTRPEAPPLRFLAGRTSTARQATPVTVEDPAGFASLEVAIVPLPLDARTTAEGAARSVADRLGGGTVSPPERLERGDGHASFAARFEARNAVGRVVVVAAPQRTFVLTAAWSERASLVTVSAITRAQEMLEVLGPPPAIAKPPEG
ncbi:MAG: hypothetical protein ACJ79E_16355, partial [Anaeromyxobacteraceae bacterium]